MINLVHFGLLHVEQPLLKEFLALTLNFLSNFNTSMARIASHILIYFFRFVFKFKKRKQKTERTKN